jgi:hypothetical protein
MQEPVYADLHPRFSWMRDHLDQVAPPGLLPGRQHIDPVALRAVLPFVNLVDVERDAASGLRFRFRLVGTVQTTAAGREISGKYLEEAVEPKYLERIRANMTAAVEQRRAIYDRFNMPHPDRDFIDSERIYFPLARDGVTVDMLLILNLYPDDEPARPTDPESTTQNRPVRGYAAKPVPRQWF